MGFLASSVLSVAALVGAHDGHAVERELLVTPHYSITVWLRCADGREGVLGCPVVGYVYNHAAVRSVQLAGSQGFISHCPPSKRCHTGDFVYVLRDKRESYTLYPSGKLVVDRAGRRVLVESGNWVR